MWDTPFEQDADREATVIAENVKAIVQDCMLKELTDYQNAILKNETLMEGLGTRCQFEPNKLADKVFILSQRLYEKTDEYIERKSN